MVLFQVFEVASYIDNTAAYLDLVDFIRLDLRRHNCGTYMVICVCVTFQRYGVCMHACVHVNTLTQTYGVCMHACMHAKPLTHDTSQKKDISKRMYVHTCMHTYKHIDSRHEPKRIFAGVVCTYMHAYIHVKISTHDTSQKRIEKPKGSASSKPIGPYKNLHLCIYRLCMCMCVYTDYVNVCVYRLCMCMCVYTDYVHVCIYRLCMCMCVYTDC